MEISSRVQENFGESVELTAVTPADFVDECAPQIVAAPRDEGAARELVALCGREKWAFVVAGSGTRIGVGAPPSRLDLRVSTKHLNQIFDHDEGNATVEAGAGLALKELNRRVGERGQFVPLDDALHLNSTLGGAVACNASGASRLKWGTPRDLVTGLRAVLSDGREVRGGAKVVKNVSGYDLPKIFTGSFGTLGLITRVTIRLRPLDAKSSTWTGAFDSLQDVRRMADEMTNGPFDATSLRASWHGEKWVLSARFDGGERAVETQIERLPKELMALSVAVSAMKASSTKFAWRLRATLPLTRAGQWFEIAQHAGANRLDWDCGLGVALAEFDELSAEKIGELRAHAETLGGWLRVDEAPIEFKTPDLVWGAPRSDWVLMKRLKEVYDAANVCAPGRFVGGL